MAEIMQTDALPVSIATSEVRPETHQTASFGTAFVGFMVTTTLTTSIMVLLSGAL